MEEIINKLRLHLEQDLPFVIYCKPGSTTLIGVFQSMPHVYDYKPDTAGFVFAPFADNKELFIPSEAATVLITECDSSVTVPEAPLQLPPIDQKAKADFEALVAKSVAAIGKGKFEKLVCSRTEEITFGSIDVVEVFKTMLQAYPNAFRYCFFDPRAGLWMGATPEQLLKIDGNTIYTVALAGTKPFKEGEAVWPEKEQQEQRFVTDYIMEELNPYVDNAEAGKPYTFRAGNIVHIKTDIRAELKDTTNVKDVIDALHPTPAVCGLPKAEAQKFLLENEGYDRGYYSGYLGEINTDFCTGEGGKTDLFANLRCMKIEDNTAHLYIGCGITKDSDPEKEFIETVNKSITMRKVLPGKNLLTRE
jgi:isochorismate synthase